MLLSSYYNSQRAQYFLKSIRFCSFTTKKKKKIVGINIYNNF